MNLVIGSTPGSPWLDECVKSLGDYPHIVLTNFNWETGKLRWLMYETHLADWVFLHDSCVVHKPWELMELFYSYDGSVSLSDCPVKFGMYMGKYKRSTLKYCHIPITNSKEETIIHERELADAYCRFEPGIPTLFPHFHDNNGYVVHKNGRDNLVLENEYLVKYKGTWR